MNGKTSALLSKEATRISSLMVGAKAIRIRREIKKKWKLTPWPERHAMRTELKAIHHIFASR